MYGLRFWQCIIVPIKFAPHDLHACYQALQVDLYVDTAEKLRPRYSLVTQHLESEDSLPSTRSGTDQCVSCYCPRGFQAGGKSFFSWRPRVRWHEYTCGCCQKQVFCCQRQSYCRLNDKICREILLAGSCNSTEGCIYVAFRNAEVRHRSSKQRVSRDHPQCCATRVCRAPAVLSLSLSSDSRNVGLDSIF